MSPIRAMRRVAILACAVAAALAAFAARPAAAQGIDLEGGSVRGTVYDKDFGVPLPGVRVTVPEAGTGAVTGPDGTFVINRLPPGTYTLSFSKDGFERELLNGVVVTSGRMADVRVELATEIVELEELVVTGMDTVDLAEIGLLEVRAAAVAVQDAVSADLIRQAGASDVSGALKLVVGASVVEGKYATVRGLSDRYTAVTLNGVRVPSADPRKRAVQIDLFPTGTIRSITVSKTFTPDMMGDFTGGNVDIETRGVPDEPVLAVSLATEYNSIATGNEDFLTYVGGGVPADGFQSGSGVPEAAAGKFPPFPRIGRNPSPEEIAAAEYYDKATRAFEPVIGVDESAPSPGRSFALSGGDRFSWGEQTLGLVGAFTYSHKYDLYLDAQNNSAAVSTIDGGLAYDQTRNDSRGTDELLMGALAAASWQPNENHRFALNLVGNHSATDEARFQVSPVGENLTEQNQSLNYAERSVASYQIQGSDTFTKLFGGGFSDLKLDWSASLNVTEQDEPDVRFFRNNFDSSTRQFYSPPNTTESYIRRRIWRNIQEDNRQFAVDLSLPFTDRKEGDGQLKFGAYRENADRDYTQTSFSYRFPIQFGTGPAVLANRALATFVQEKPGQLWTDVFLQSRRVGLADNRCVVSAPPCAPAPNQLLWTIDRLASDVDYTGEQHVSGYYAMAEIPLGKRVELVGGARREGTDFSIVPTNPILGLVEVVVTDEDLNRYIVLVPDEQGQASIQDARWLPALGVIVELAPSMKLRAHYAQTIARPTYRELAPVATEEYLAGDEFLGNPDLKLSSIANYDLRWEWFPAPGDVIAASLFYKEITDPIEYISFGATNRTFIQPLNYGAGRVRGIELEYRQTLGWIWEPLKYLAFGANGTWLDSEVEVPASEQKALADYALDEDSRPLQGQPAYLLNLNLTYDNPDSGTTVGVFYNLVGETLFSGAARGNEDAVPDVFEQAFSVFDVTFTQRLWRALTLVTKATNLLGDDRGSFYRMPDGTEATKVLREAASTYQVGLSYRW